MEWTSKKSKKGISGFWFRLTKLGRWKDSSTAHGTISFELAGGRLFWLGCWLACTLPGGRLRSKVCPRWRSTLKRITTLHRPLPRAWRTSMMDSMRRQSLSTSCGASRTSTSQRLTFSTPLILARPFGTTVLTWARRTTRSRFLTFVCSSRTRLTYFTRLIALNAGSRTSEPSYLIVASGSLSERCPEAMEGVRRRSNRNSSS